MSERPDLSRLGPPALRTAWLFQAAISGPSFLFLGINSLSIIYYPYASLDIYPAIKEMALALIAAAILYILLVQRKYPEPHPKVTARFELAKGLLATSAWLWLLLDAIFREIPWDSKHRLRKRRIVFVSVSVVIVFLFFYPTVFWSARVAKESRREVATREDEPSEESPLLEA